MVTTPAERVDVAVGGTSVCLRFDRGPRGVAVEELERDVAMQLYRDLGAVLARTMAPPPQYAIPRPLTLLP